MHLITTIWSYLMYTFIVWHPLWPACPAFSYGPECTSRCGACLNGFPCNAVDGSCPKGCAPGLLPPMCVDGELRFVAFTGIVEFLLLNWTSFKTHRLTQSVQHFTFYTFIISTENKPTYIFMFQHARTFPTDPAVVAAVAHVLAAFPVTR